MTLYTTRWYFDHKSFEEEVASWTAWPSKRGNDVKACFFQTFHGSLELWSLGHGSHDFHKILQTVA